MTTPEPVPHMVTRHIPGGHNMLNQYISSKTYEEQNGWKIDADGLHSWATTREEAVRMWERMRDRRHSNAFNETETS